VISASENIQGQILSEPPALAYRKLPGPGAKNSCKASPGWDRNHGRGRPDSSKYHRWI